MPFAPFSKVSPMSETKLRELLHDLADSTPGPDPALPRHVTAGTRRRIAVRVGSAIVALALIAVVTVSTTRGLLASDHKPAQHPTGPPQIVGAIPNIDYVIDLTTGQTTPVPDAIVRSLGKSRQSGQFAASLDGSQLAFVGTGEEGIPQIFVARLDGTGVRQVTHDPTGASSPAWSPDGTRIAYLGSRIGQVGNLFVLDVSSGRLRHVTGRTAAPGSLQFTPDGSALLYTWGPGPGLRIVSVEGGKSTLLIEPGRGLHDAGNGSLSPDGSLVTYLGGGSPLSPDGSPLTYQGHEIEHAGPGRFLSHVDGTGFRFLPGGASNTSGTWSPDGTRIVCSGDDGVSGGGVLVIDVATGDITHRVEGRSAIWVDDHRLLVEA
jgi:Tol biopolymer transport system component